MSAEERIEYAKLIADSLQPNKAIEEKVLYALQRHLSLALEAIKEEEEPYFGWCDVRGCENEGAAGGMAWREHGYWTTCSKHCQQFRDGKPFPKMKPDAIQREAQRKSDPNGWLTKTE